MKINMQDWVKNVLSSDTRKAFPLMPYIGLNLTGKKILEAVRDALVQSQCVKEVAYRYASIASVTIMDLSVECEAFGGTIRFAENEVPTAIGTIVNDVADAIALKVPGIGSGRTGEYIRSAALSASLITDRPLFGCLIGPFSLAARLCGMTEIMIKIRKDPNMIDTVMGKCTDFLLEYAKAYKESGVNGIVIAEPAAGLINPSQCEMFSSHHIKRIVSALQDDHFMIILHNCGNTLKLVPALLSTGVMGIHFGNAVDMSLIMPQMPAMTLAFGNIDPVLLKNGSRDDVRKKTTDLLVRMDGFRNFVLSSGCDVPPGTPLENIDGFFEALMSYNKR
jgi:uroporphyrinogen decarboxylase